MQDQLKTKAQLIEELNLLRQQNTELSTGIDQQENELSMLRQQFTGLTDVSDYRQVEKRLAYEVSLNQCMADLASDLILADTINDATTLVLNYALKLTHSPIGFVGFIDSSTGYLIVPNKTHCIWNQAQIIDKDIIFKEFKGLWGWVLNNKKPLLTNEPEKDSRSAGIPHGHINIKRFLSVPAIHGNSLLGQINVANSEEPYEQRDLITIQRLASIYALGIKRKQAVMALEKSEEHFRKITEANLDTIFQLDNYGVVQYCSQAVKRLLGFNAEDLTGTHYSRYVPKTKLPEIDQIFHRIVQGEMVENLELQIFNIKGEAVFIEMNVLPLHDHDQVIGLQGIARDITERKNMTEQIKASLKEKEILLREIHHRVKNNMQIILGLIKILYSNIQDQQAIDKLIESENRIRSMAHVHDKLYQTQDFSNIEFYDYIVDLTNELFVSYGINFKKVALKTEIEKITLTLDQAIPCGLVINELVTNALKYAFPKNRTGEIKINFQLIENEVNLVICDNGIGLPKNFDLTTSKTQGLLLVKGLVSQLYGKILIKKTNGTRFHIKFNKV